MIRHGTAGLITVLVLAGLARGNSDSASAAGLAWGKAAMEFATATAGGAVCYVPALAAGWLAASAAEGHWIDIETNGGLWYISAGAVAGVVLGSAGTVCLTDHLFPGRHGKFLGALAGAAVGAAVGAPLVYVTDEYLMNPDVYFLAVGTFFALSAAGAVAGYDLSRPSQPTASAEHFVILPPTLSFAPELRTNGRRSPTICAQLINVRL